jgi:NADH-quinone oxidoreductase subunit L
MTVIAAGMTAFYSWRLIYKTFHGAPHDQQHYEAAHESPLVILIPLGVLAVGSLAPACRSRNSSPATRSSISSASR